MYFLEYVCLGLACVFWTVVLGNNMYVEDCGVCGDCMIRGKNSVSWDMTQRSLSRPGPRTPLFHTQHFPFPPALSLPLPASLQALGPTRFRPQTPSGKHFLVKGVAAAIATGKPSRASPGPALSLTPLLGRRKERREK